MLPFLAAVMFTTSLVTTVTAQTTQPKQQMFDVTNLFTAGDSDYATYRIPAITITRKGTIIVGCAARLDGHGDWVNIDTMIRRSTDNGGTWEPAVKVTDVGTSVVDNATFIAMPDRDRVLLMYQVGYAKAYVKTSDDEGATWSEPREITGAFETYRSRDRYDWKVIAMGPGHGIVLKNGRMLVPVWLATDHSHRPSVSSTIYSDDHGETWQAGEIVTQDKPESRNPSENVLIELADGRVMNNIRCESKEHRRLVAFSKDGTTQWTTPAPDKQLFEPICMASMARMSLKPDAMKNRILFANPDSEGSEAALKKRGAFIRKNVTVRLSYDEGQTWPVARVVEPGPSGYSDMAVANDGTVFMALERGDTRGENTFAPKFFSVARFNLAWLTDGKDLER